MRRLKGAIGRWLGSLLSTGVPARYRARTCQGRAWKAAFPQASADQVRGFLRQFCEAFAFAEGEGLRFAPTDDVLGVYRALHPSRWTPDALEMESFAKALRRTYGLQLAELWNDRLTLGDVFARTLTRATPAR